MVCGVTAAPGAVGCTTHQCDPSTVTIEADAGNAGLVHQEGDTFVWESSTLDGPWLDFPGERTYVFNFPEPFMARQPETVIAYVASDHNAQSNFVIASGQLAEFSLAPNTLTVLNATCAEYFLRVVAYASPPDAGSRDAGGPDAGADASTGGS
jgi:hypothetical protein